MKDVTAKVTPGDATVFVDGFRWESLNQKLRGKTAAARRGQWAKTKRERAFANMICRVYIGPNVALPVTITLTRIAPRKLDTMENLAGGAKAITDGIADWLGVADNDPRVSWRYAQERGEARQFAVRIRVQAREA